MLGHTALWYGLPGPQLNVARQLQVIAARLGKPCNEEVAQDGLATLHLSLELLGGYWLAGGRRAYMGRDEAEGGAAGPGLGDLLCCSELEQLVMLRREAHGMDMETILQPYPLVGELP